MAMRSKLIYLSLFSAAVMLAVQESRSEENVRNDHEDSIVDFLSTVTNAPHICFIDRMSRVDASGNDLSRHFRMEGASGGMGNPDSTSYLCERIAHIQVFEASTSLLAILTTNKSSSIEASLKIRPAAFNDPDSDVESRSPVGPEVCFSLDVSKGILCSIEKFQKLGGEWELVYKSKTFACLEMPSILQDFVGVWRRERN